MKVIFASITFIILVNSAVSGGESVVDFIEKYKKEARHRQLRNHRVDYKIDVEDKLKNTKHTSDNQFSIYNEAYCAETTDNPGSKEMIYYASGNCPSYRYSIDNRDKKIKKITHLFEHKGQPYHSQKLLDLAYPFLTATRVEGTNLPLIDLLEKYQDAGIMIENDGELTKIS
jgi:hypothetical protein